MTHPLAGLLQTPAEAAETDLLEILSVRRVMEVPS